MMWTHHFLDARGGLAPHRDRISEALDDVQMRAADVVVVPALDIVVQAVRYGGIPEIGYMGYTPRPGVIFLTLDPYSSALATTMGVALERTIAHELHHALRWDTVGYGVTLGGALVSEGLAGHFVRQLYDNPPEMWEDTVAPGEVAGLLALAAEAWDKTDYDHARWFFGTADLPRWLGYTLGYRLIGAWLRQNGTTAAAQAGVDASEMRTLRVR